MELVSLPINQYAIKISYTQLKRVTDAEYEKTGPKLIKQAARYLDRYEAAASFDSAMRELTNLNEVVLELSTLHQAWNEFSLAVFEHYVTPAKTSYQHVAKALKGQFQSVITNQQKGSLCPV